MNTKPTKQKEIQRAWHLIDVDDKVLGRIAPQIALLLRGKAKPYFVSNMDCGDYVVVVNSSKVAVTGTKETEKTYSRYSGYPSGQKVETLGTLRDRQPNEIIRHAVSGMLPKNKLRAQWLSRLYIYPRETHPYNKEIQGVK